MLVGKKVYLAAVLEESLEQLRIWRNSHEIKQYTREHREITQQMQKKWYETQVNNNDSQIHFEIRTVKDNKLVGHCVLTNIHWIYRVAEFGIYIGDNKRRGKKLGREALKLLIDYGFNVINMNRIWGEVYEDNPALNVFKAIGFKEECIMRQARFMHGEYCDINIVGLLKKEWDDINHKET